MTASEFAFLALGLVLGVASGAALIEVLRSRPPASREVRVTVSPNAIHSRMAATLAEGSGPARGGPGDRRTTDEIALTGEPAATGRRVKAGSAAPGTPVRMVAVPMSMEPDPLTAAFRASAARPAAMATSSGSAASAAGGTPAARSSGSNVAIGDRPTGRGGSTGAAPAAGPTAAGASPSGGAPAGGPTGGGATAGGATSTGPGPASPPAPPATPAATPAANGPCAEERRVADERCAVATRAREGAATAADALRQAQRTYDEHVARAEAVSELADPRAVRSAKEQAQQRFREARNQAKTRDDVEAGARAWLAEINRINHETREASSALERDRAAAAALVPALERLAVEADAARITSERADEACTAARDAVADCDEARTLEEAAERSANDPDATTEDGDAGEGRIAAATPEPEDEFEFSTRMHSQAGQDALILRILRGEHDALQQAVGRLAGDDADARRLWQTQLGGLAEALIARSIEAVAFDFPLEHPFWGPFNQAQNRDIAAGLSSLGFRFDGFGGWVDDRLPSQRDLSLAVGYAGLDPMRVRRWPTEAETQELLRDVRVAADEYVAGAAGGLTLGELVTLLGRRADGLTELWNSWGIVRPILLEAG